LCPRSQNCIQMAAPAKGASLLRRMIELRVSHLGYPRVRRCCARVRRLRGCRILGRAGVRSLNIIVSGICRLHRDDLVRLRLLLVISRYLQEQTIVLDSEFSFLADGKNPGVFRIHRPNVVIHFVRTDAGKIYLSAENSLYRMYLRLKD